jgi:SPASM domain peptide maturase of grasp-with-spasm system
MNQFFFLNTNIRLTKGIKRSLLIDLFHEVYFVIPNSLFEFLKTYNGKTLEHIYTDFKKDEHSTIEEYLGWLSNHNLIIISDNSMLKNIFDSLETEWDMPYEITNCILEMDERNIDFSKQTLINLSENRIPFVEIRFDWGIGLPELVDVIKIAQRGTIKSVSLFINFSPSYTKKIFERYLKYLTVLDKIIIYNAPYSLEFKLHNGLTSVSFIEEEITSFSCGIISEKYFRANRPFYSETQKHNTCLNRKIAISKNGDIKNCPSFLTTYGNIRDISISEAINLPGFKDLWTITKKDISTCKICEFRDVCSDCRFFLEEPNNIYSKPLKCGYNPFTNEWEDWFANPLNSTAIKYYEI